MVKVHCLEAFDAFCQKWGIDALAAYIDDLTITAHASSDPEVFDKILEMAQDLQQLVEKALGCTIALDKTTVVASNQHLAESISAATQELGGHSADSAVNLGVDYRAGKKRGHGTDGALHKRIAEGEQRKKRLTGLRKTLGGRKAIPHCGLRHTRRSRLACLRCAAAPVGQSRLE